MTRAPLEHTYPQWNPPEDDPCAPEEDWRETQYGVMRIVRSRKRARVLKRRGVPLWNESGCWLWFVAHPRLEAERRKRFESYNRGDIPDRV
jgi:hypothetical protein